MPNSSKKMVAIRNERGKVMGYIALYWSNADQDYVVTPPKYSRKRKPKGKPLTAGLRYYSPKQITLMLGIHVETVYRWLRNGTMRGTKMSRRSWHISSADFRRYLKANNINSA